MRQQICTILARSWFTFWLTQRDRMSWSLAWTFTHTCLEYSWKASLLCSVIIIASSLTHIKTRATAVSSADMNPYRRFTPFSKLDMASIRVLLLLIQYVLNGKMFSMMSSIIMGGYRHKILIRLILYLKREAIEVRCQKILEDECKSFEKQMHCYHERWEREESKCGVSWGFGSGRRKCWYFLGLV